MTFSFKFRPETIDKSIFHTVTTYNEYRLPAAIEAGQIVIDIGAHIGSFSYAALARGATCVYGFEPEIENYRYAVENLRSFGDRVHLSNTAVWRSDRPVEKLFLTGSADRGNTSGGGVVWANGGQEVQVIAFDQMLRDITHNGEKRIHLLKIDCEGAEFPILLTSRMLHTIDNICGEFHETGGAFETGQIPERARVEGVDQFTIAELSDALQRAGFRVEWQRQDRSHMGLFFATRGPNQFFATDAGAKSALTRRFVSWSHRSYGHETPPGVVSRSALRLDGYEGSHLGAGWHAVEQGFRWTQQQARALLHRGRGQDTLEIDLGAGPEALGPVSVAVEAAGVTIEQQLSSRPWQQLRLSLPPIQAEQAILPVTISVDRTRSAAQLGAGDARDLGVAVRSLTLRGRLQTLRLPLSSVCNPEHWNNPFWRRCLDSMSFQAPFGTIAPEVLHRKLWEWVQGVAALARLGCLKPSAHALGVAAGHEPVIYWLASRVAQVYATDLYSGVFAEHEASPDVLRDPDKYAPYPYPRERVHFMPMSGTDICFGDQTIDVVFSFSSIEHFGSRANSRRALQEMARVLRPGGIAVVSTEVLLNDVAPQTDMFSPWEIYEELIAPSGLLLIGDIAPANLAPYCAYPIDFPGEAISGTSRPHFVLRYGDVLFTSVMLVLQKV